MSSTECGRRNHSTSSAARLRASSVDTCRGQDGRKVPVALNSVGRRSCLAVTIQTATDNATPTATDAPQHCAARRSPDFGAAIAVFQQRIAEDDERKSAVPDLVEPGRGLRTGIEQPGRSKHAGKGQGVDDRGGRGEQISARQQQQSPRPQQAELRKQQDRRDQIVDCKRGLIARDERRDRGKRHGGKRHGKANRTAETPTTASAAARSRLVAGKVERKMLRSLPVCTHSLRQTGIERANRFASSTHTITHPSRAGNLADMRISTGRNTVVHGPGRIGKRTGPSAIHRMLRLHDAESTQGLLITHSVCRRKAQ